ncbi:HLA class II histocompatibility antigen, DM beta chain-like [Rana temporaria]|uniref:HLA class II histocompatibility antigen, DM beta chain-like n=1 Tax=Rana temporaria TaxID=8407 RepID=UPI001AADCAD8|nr:HLA class II histocompatibility antigen, DM beta chain-like [Rana temporaria]
MMSSPPDFPLAAEFRTEKQTSGFQFCPRTELDDSAEMNAASTALLLMYGSLWPFGSGYVMQEISMCLFDDNKEGDIIFKYQITFNRQPFLYYNENDKQFNGCFNCIPQMQYLSDQVAQLLNKNPKYVDLVEGEEGRCKEDVRTFWNKTVERKVKPSVEVFSPVQIHPEGLPVLVCHVWGFYPPEISVAWFKNDVLVKNYTEAERSGDWTYRIMAVLDMRDSLPEDNYTCLVNHPSLGMAITRSWKHGLTNIQIIKIGVASVVFALGLVFLITGIACWKNAKRSGYSPIPGVQ